MAFGHWVIWYYLVIRIWELVIQLALAAPVVFPATGLQNAEVLAR